MELVEAKVSGGGAWFGVAVSVWIYPTFLRLRNMCLQSLISTLCVGRTDEYSTFL
jgi:hypothetical protein